MEIRRLESGATILAFQPSELKIALGILKAIYTCSKLSFVKEAIDDIETELRPRLTLVSHFHFCNFCCLEIDDRVGDNFIHYINGDKNYWRHRFCPTLKQPLIK